MANILIRTKPETVEHKIEESVESGCICWWTLSVLPTKEVKKVLFTDGKTVFAEGEYYGKAEDEEGRPCIEFSPLKRVNYPQPKQAPTRGFTYVD